VLVLTGASIPDSVVPALTERDVSITRGNLTALELLRAILRALSGAKCGDFGRWARNLPPALRRTFLAAPASVRDLSDIGAILGVSRDTARSVLRDVQIGSSRFGDSRHLRTWMIAEYWTDLVRLGLPRKQVEAFLGITSRSDFRRACRRAGCSPPWQRRDRESRHGVI
jgi:hypothetical protein